MESKFKVGDKVVCVDEGACFSTYSAFASKHSLHGYVDWKDMSMGCEATVVVVAPHDNTASYGLILGVVDSKGQQYIIGQEGVKLAEPCNGTDSEGLPLHFTQDMLKSWMRVVIGCGAQMIVAENEGKMFYITNKSVIGFNGPNFVYTDSTDEDFVTSEVYAAPQYNCEFLDEGKRGKLIWRRNPPKTAEQLAQEKAVAERKAAIATQMATIEEAEKALKQAQEALEKLKGSV